LAKRLQEKEILIDIGPEIKKIEKLTFFDEIVDSDEKLYIERHKNEKDDLAFAKHLQEQEEVF
jgi:hypothetical protein